MKNHVRGKWEKREETRSLDKEGCEGREDTAIGRYGIKKIDLPEYWMRLVQDM